MLQTNKIEKHTKVFMNEIFVFGRRLEVRLVILKLYILFCISTSCGLQYTNQTQKYKKNNNKNQTTTTTSVEIVVYLKIKKSFLKFIVMVIIFKHGNLIFNFKAVPYGFWNTKKSSRCHREY